MEEPVTWNRVNKVEEGVDVLFDGLFVDFELPGQLSAMQYARW